jgi:RHS repeat-associated protein
VPWATSATFGYDGNGNRQREDLGRRLDSGWINWSTTYTWDPGNHLLQVTHSSGSTGTDQTNSYRPDGLRHRKTEGATTVQMLWDRQDVLAMVDGSGGLSQFFSGGPTLVKNHLPSAFYVDQYQHLDEQGTVVIQSDPTGAAIVGVVDPNPWGGYNTLNPIGWLGQPGYWYEATLRRPLYYVRARWYQTGGPGWLSADPLRFSGGDWNLYRYVANRPTVAVDPSGFDASSHKPVLPPGYKFYSSICGNVMVVRKISADDANCINRALCWMSKIHGVKASKPDRIQAAVSRWKAGDSSTTYYVATFSNSCQGLTSPTLPTLNWTSGGHDKDVFIAEENFAQCSSSSKNPHFHGQVLSVMKELGITVIHEITHVLDPSLEDRDDSNSSPQPNAVQSLIDDPLADEFVDLQKKHASGCITAGGRIFRFKNTAEKYALQCGIFFK